MNNDSCFFSGEGGFRKTKTKKNTDHRQIELEILKYHHDMITSCLNEEFIQNEKKRVKKLSSM